MDLTTHIIAVTVGILIWTLPMLYILFFTDPMKPDKKVKNLMDWKKLMEKED